MLTLQSPPSYWLLVAQTESSLAPEFWNVNQNHCRWSPENLAESGTQWACWLLPPCWTPSENCIHRQQLHPPCVQDAWNVTPAGAEACRGISGWKLCSGGFWSKYWKQGDYWVVSLLSGTTVQEGAARSHSLMFFSFPLHLTPSTLKQ